MANKIDRQDPYKAIDPVWKSHEEYHISSASTLVAGYDPVCFRINRSFGRFKILWNLTKRKANRSDKDYIDPRSSEEQKRTENIEMAFRSLVQSTKENQLLFTNELPSEGPLGIKIAKKDLIAWLQTTAGQSLIHDLEERGTAPAPFLYLKDPPSNAKGMVNLLKNMISYYEQGGTKVPPFLQLCLYVFLKTSNLKSKKTSKQIIKDYLAANKDSIDQVLQDILGNSKKTIRYTGNSTDKKEAYSGVEKAIAMILNLRPGGGSPKSNPE